MGAGVRIVRVLLTASDTTARERLAGRELGSQLEQETKASMRKAQLLDERAVPDAVQVPTDGRPVVDVAREVVATTGRCAQPYEPRSRQRRDRALKAGLMVKAARQASL